ncbi:aminopeptidase N [Simiduia agarivorans]|uniref:Aminopeptidase N n=1 Tax=Simiduia agarivorans (strain DSM 21679 / JCM 13881 / BCRC 17597 / SA1) TaxID=1117647 RepID=K4KHJ1_SIMAS|nr:aminopeptidase N [Simiduia agarivorans]AFU97428.1 aminopeptidase N [Simiduia agarivorans SA1 = DSM 21679]
MSEPKVIYLKDYQPPAFAIEQTQLNFDIGPDSVIVSSRLRVVPCGSDTDLVLQGENLTTLAVSLDGVPVDAARMTETESTLTVRGIDSACWLETRVAIDPWGNSSLEGLYKSRTMFCTQCEAEGFRKITWFLDRPDVLSVYTTRVEADKSDCPILLSNGNCINRGDLSDGRHFAEWHDPHPKPSYLFALVAGDLECVTDEFVTVSGRRVVIEVYVEPKDLDKCAHAIASLKRAMRWDEEKYGREYDLDCYMIVAVDDFNMGAMENKGLNIFNTSCVLAHPATTTDAGFQRVEAVVAHEYFHNWSGNRVTCRDWFQLSLKEGFTVYRDACFSADMNSATVKRIEDVNLLRSAQFAEDAGPLAHAVRPASFIEISNFYTLTIYEKGAEIVRMLANMLGPETFRQATDRYFERFDGQAVTCDDFLSVMEEVSGRDLSRFARWYSQAGTPVIDVQDEYNAESQIYRMTLRQSCRPTPETPDKQPFHIPVRIGLLGEAGALALYCDQLATQELADNTDVVLELTDTEQTFVFTRVPERPVPSLCRNFSAPVHVRYPYDEPALVQLLARDDDLFNRWQASQEIAIRHIAAELDGNPLSMDRWTGALEQCLADAALDSAVMAELLHLPTMSYLIDRLEGHDVLALHAARKTVEEKLAIALKPRLHKALQAYHPPAQYQPEAGQIARRSLRNVAARLCVIAGWEQAADWIEAQVRAATNMTDQLAALRMSLLLPDADVSARCLDYFFQQWSHEALVVNQWLAVQAADERGDTLVRLQRLTETAGFQWGNPNKVRALVGTFAGQNYPQFHRNDGQGYQWLADVVGKLDQSNPQLASRLVTPLTRWKQYGARGTAMRNALQGLAGQDLSRDLYEVVHKAL